LKHEQAAHSVCSSPHPNSGLPEFGTFSRGLINAQPHPY
jgi:hypothetical protein